MFITSAMRRIRIASWALDPSVLIVFLLAFQTKPNTTHGFATRSLTSSTRITLGTPRSSSELCTATTATASSESSSGVIASSAAAAAANGSIDLPHMEYYNPDVTTSTPVLLLHGLLGSKRNFATIAKSLGSQLDSQRRIMGVDLRNHGDNNPESWQDDMSYESMANDVLQFIHRQNLDKVIVVGHSMGGKVAQTLALLEPDIVEGLVVLDMAPVAYESNEPHWKAVTSIIETLRSVPTGEGATKQTVDRHLQSTIPDPALRGFCLTNWNVKEKTWSIPVDKIAKQLDTLAAFDITPKDGTYGGDVFFIHGGQSKFVRTAHMPTIAQYFPNHMLTTIRGAGHWVHAEAPDDTIALIKRYLDR